MNVERLIEILITVCLPACVVGFVFIYRAIAVIHTQVNGMREAFTRELDVRGSTREMVMGEAKREHERIDRDVNRIGGIVTENRILCDRRAQDSTEMLISIQKLTAQIESMRSDITQLRQEIRYGTTKGGIL